MCFENAADFKGTLCWRFGTGVEDQRHTVAGWNFNQTSRRFGALILIRTANDLGQLFNECPLLVNRKLGVTDDVDEQDMGNLEPDLLFNLSRHINAPTARTRMIYNLDSTADSREQSSPLERSPCTATAACPSPFNSSIPSRSLSP